MANEYRATLAGLEALEQVTPQARLTVNGLEVQQTDDDATEVRVTQAYLEVQQTDDNATDIAVSLVGLEVLLSVAEGHDSFTSAAFAGEGGFAITGGQIIPGAFLSLRFEGLVSFEAANAQKFSCAAPQRKAWARHTVTAKAWTCAVVTPATSCDDEVATPETADALAYTTGDIFATVQGYQLKLIG